MESAAESAEKASWIIHLIGKILTVIFSACWHLALFRRFSKYPQKYADDSVKIQRADYKVSLCHAVITSTLSLYFQVEVFYELDIHAFFNEQGSTTFQYLSCFLIGYMIYDLQTVTLYKGTRSMLYVFHHFISIAGAFIGVCGKFPALICPLFLGELPVIFVDIQVLCELSGHKTVACLISPVSIVLWVIFRLGVVPFICVKIQNYLALHSLSDKNSFLLLVVIFASLSVMNLFWCVKLVKRSVKQLRKLKNQ